MPLPATGTPDVAALESENRRLSRAVRELSVLNDLARAISASRNSESIMKTIIARSLEAVDAEQGTITLVGRDAAAPTNTLVRAMVSSSIAGAFHLTDALLGWMQLNKSPLVVDHPASDQRFLGVVWDERIDTLLCVPLIVKGALTGILSVYNRRGGGKFDADDQRLLAILATQSAQIIEAARLYEEERTLARMRHQLALAAEIQQHLLPANLPALDGYDLAGTSIAAETVGGDYFDIIATPGERWTICLGDVSGKGIPASLLMSNVQAMIRLLARMNVAPCEAMRRANELLIDCTPTEKFVTFFLASLDPSTGRLDFCNAGHNPPQHLRASGERTHLASGGAVLGIIPSFPYTGNSIDVAPGDVVVIYSDGVTEAVDIEDDEFGEERLAAVVSEHATEGARAIQDAIIAAVRAHAGKQPQSDDITLVVLKRLAT